MLFSPRPSRLTLEERTLPPVAAEEPLERVLWLTELERTEPLEERLLLVAEALEPLLRVL